VAGQAIGIGGDGVQMLLDLAVEIDGSARPACVARVIHRHFA
jgi:hypothetical protein